MSYQYTKYILIFVFGFFNFINASWGAPGQGSSACDGAQLVLQSALINLNIDPTPALPMTISRSGSGACNFFIVIDNGSSAGNFSTRRLTHGNFPPAPIQFYKEAGHTNIVKSVIEATSSNDIITGSFSGNTSQTMNNYYADFDPNVSVVTGPYNDSFSISLYTWDGSNLSSKVHVQTRSVNFNFTKSDSVDISLVDTGAAFNINDTTQSINFGSLTTGASMGFDILLKYSAGYVLSMSSMNASKIKNSVNADYIPYSIKLDGAPLTLTNIMQIVKSGAGLSPLGGARLPVSVTIGNVGGVTSGTYTDTVSISVSSAN